MKTVSALQKKIAVTYSLLCLALYPSVAMAYIGPGLGTGVVATVLGIAAGILMLLVAVIWYPVKKLIQRFKAKKD
jgi:hypothetical protein